MRIFHVSDIQDGAYPLQHIVNFVNQEGEAGDLVVMSGDIATGADADHLRKSLDELCRDRDRITVQEFRTTLQNATRPTYEKIKEVIEKSKVPVLSIPGNSDLPLYENALQSDKHIPLHERAVDIGGMNFVGFGGANIAVIDDRYKVVEVSVEVNDTIMGKKSVKASSIYDFLKTLSETPTVLVMHMPPYGIRDFVNQEVGHVGSHGLRDYLDENAVPLVLCGHIHEGRGMEALNQGRTVVSNAGTLSNMALHKKLPRTFAVVEYDGGFKAGIVYQFTDIRKGSLEVLTTYKPGENTLLVENRSNPKFS
ncbi:metallophosphoesterase [Candidatus Woesearchaeota archaeon]|nr:metallophosphoesterase [Candidatus Woesearchaeota archaeon]